MENRSGHVVSAGQIARALGRSPRAVRDSLLEVSPASSTVRSGNVCHGYTVEQLPAAVYDALNRQKVDLRYRSILDVINDPKLRWEPPVPLKDQPAEMVSHAHKLRQALRFAITNRNDAKLRSDDLTSRAMSDYEKAFGKSINRRHIYRQIVRVLERDNGREEFDRLELYLPETAKQKEGDRAGSLGLNAHFVGLGEAIPILHDVSALTVADKLSLWNAAMAAYGSLIDSGLVEKKAKRYVLDFLSVRVPTLADGKEALRKQFDRKASAYCAGGVAALCDKRRGNSGRKKIVDPNGVLTEDERLLLARANSVGGGISQAFRDLYLGARVSTGRVIQFSSEFREAYSFNPRENKSYVPQGLRDKLRPLLNSIKPLNHGPKTAKLASPSIRRNWDNLAAGAWYQSDDETGNHYIWSEDDGGEYEFQGMRFNVLRPQILPMVDVRTDYVLSVLLLCQSQYNSRSIRSLILNTCLDERVGLPFDGFYFERNIWQARNIANIVNWSTVERGFGEAGISLSIRHATTPKAKIIERIFSQEQNTMQALPGYAGRNERTDGYERVRSALGLLKKVGQPRKEETAPWEHFMSAEKYLDHLQLCYERFNNEVQNGKRLPGISPAEGWRQLSGGRAHHLLPNSLRYLMATEQTEVRVTHEGVTIRLGKTSRSFFESDRLGSLIGEKVIVRWNQEYPDDVIVVHPKSDPHGLNPFIVKHEAELDAINATKEDFTAARQRRSQFTQPQRSLFRMLNHEYGRTVRDEALGTPDLRAAGTAHARTEAGIIEIRSRRQEDEKGARLAAQRAGLDASRIKHPERAARELVGLEDVKERIRLKEAQKHE